MLCRRRRGITKPGEKKRNTELVGLRDQHTIIIYAVICIIVVETLF